MILSDYIFKRRTDRLDEWSMDELSRLAKGLEDKIHALEYKDKQYSDNWISVREFKKSNKDGFCWLSYKGKVVSAYYSVSAFRGLGLFHFGKTNSNCYMTECITAVMRMKEPEPPKEQS